MTPFAEWLQTEMTARGVNKNQLAAYTGLNPSVIGAWFTKDVLPSTPRCATLARYLHLPLETVLQKAGHLPALAEERAPYGAALPDWTRLLPMLSQEDALYVGRLVERLAQNPAQPDPPTAPEEPR